MRLTIKKQIILVTSMVFLIQSVSCRTANPEESNLNDTAFIPTYALPDIASLRGTTNEEKAMNLVHDARLQEVWRGENYNYIADLVLKATTENHLKKIVELVYADVRSPTFYSLVDDSTSDIVSIIRSQPNITDFTFENAVFNLEERRNIAEATPQAINDRLAKELVEIESDVSKFRRWLKPCVTADIKLHAAEVKTPASYYSFLRALWACTRSESIFVDRAKGLTNTKFFKSLVKYKSRSQTVLLTTAMESYVSADWAFDLITQMENDKPEIIDALASHFAAAKEVRTNSNGDIIRVFNSATKDDTLQKLNAWRSSPPTRDLPSFDLKFVKEFSEIYQVSDEKILEKISVSATSDSTKRAFQLLAMQDNRNFFDYASVTSLDTVEKTAMLEEYLSQLERHNEVIAAIQAGAQAGRTDFLEVLEKDFQGHSLTKQILKQSVEDHRLLLKDPNQASKLLKIRIDTLRSGLPAQQQSLFFPDSLKTVVDGVDSINGYYSILTFAKRFYRELKNPNLEGSLYSKLQTKAFLTEMSKSTNRNVDLICRFAMERFIKSSGIFQAMLKVPSNDDRKLMQLKFLISSKIETRQNSSGDIIRIFNSLKVDEFKKALN
jgi:hypothetical protein